MRWPLCRLTPTGCCRLCRQSVWSAAQGICSFCWPTEWLPNALAQACCRRCGLPTALPQALCGRCLQKPPPWDALLAVAPYGPPVSLLINQFKFQRRFELAPTLARLLLLRWLAQRRWLALERPDLLLPVPLHWWRHWRRGFNQSSLLAASLAHWLGVAWDGTLLQRVQATVPQQQLPALARRRNLRRAFALAPGTEAQLAGRRVVLIDDVVTTGSTVAALSQLLRRAGVAEIHIWTLGRTQSLW